jgi:hypothetical protein
MLCTWHLNTDPINTFREIIFELMEPGNIEMQTQLLEYIIMVTNVTLEMKFNAKDILFMYRNMPKWLHFVLANPAIGYLNE